VFWGRPGRRRNLGRTIAPGVYRGAIAIPQTRFTVNFAPASPARRAQRFLAVQRMRCRRLVRTFSSSVSEIATPVFRWCRSGSQRATS
jgi:hypothetical protein